MVPKQEIQATKLNLKKIAKCQLIFCITFERKKKSQLGFKLATKAVSQKDHF